MRLHVLYIYVNLKLETCHVQAFNDFHTTNLSSVGLHYPSLDVCVCIYTYIYIRIYFIKEIYLCWSFHILKF